MGDFNERYEVSEYGRGVAKQKFILDKVANPQEREDPDDGFIVFDLGDVIAKQRQWKELLQRVKPFYAVKCRPYPVILKTMAGMGLSFDCASKAEIESILQLGVEPSRIIYSHTRKQPSTLEYAVAKNINMTTFDDEQELIKIKQIHPKARLLLRFAMNDTTAVFAGGLKFGCKQDKITKLLETAKIFDMNVVGVHFHIGTGNSTPTMYCKAIALSRQIFNEAEEMGFTFTTLDIGGGFPGDAVGYGNFDKYAEAVNSALDEYFPADSEVDIIAEPGTYYMHSAGTVVTCVIGKRLRNRNNDIKQDGGMEGHINNNNNYQDVQYDYFLNDSLYGSLRDVIYTPDEYHPIPLKAKVGEISEGPLYNGVLYGNTCCGTDIIMQKCSLPELDDGDWIYFDDKGDYSHMTTDFNGFKRPFCYYVIPDNCRCLLPFIKNTTLRNQVINGFRFSFPEDEFQLVRCDSKETKLTSDVGDRELHQT